MADATVEDVRTAFEESTPVGGEVLEVERNRSQYRVFLDPDGVSLEAVETTLFEAFGEEAVFGVNLTDEMWGDDDLQVRVVSFRLR